MELTATAYALNGTYYHMKRTIDDLMGGRKSVAFVQGELEKDLNTARRVADKLDPQMHDWLNGIAKFNVKSFIDYLFTAKQPGLVLLLNTNLARLFKVDQVFSFTIDTGIFRVEVVCDNFNPKTRAESRSGSRTGLRSETKPVTKILTRPKDKKPAMEFSQYCQLLEGIALTDATEGVNVASVNTEAAAPTTYSSAVTHITSWADDDTYNDMPVRQATTETCEVAQRDVASRDAKSRGSRSQQRSRNR